MRRFSLITGMGTTIYCYYSYISIVLANDTLVGNVGIIGFGLEFGLELLDIGIGLGLEMEIG